jgi:hemerythrin-like metal-binding protein
MKLNQINSQTVLQASGNAQEILEWNDRYLLGFGPMDETHEEFVSLVGRMQLAPDQALESLLSELAAHATKHFEMENQWMTQTEFPARSCHIDEHAAVMKSVEEVRELLAQGNTDVCRRLVKELAGWFPAHADHLDSALSHWMCKLRFGGKPVVIRRDITIR